MIDRKKDYVESGVLKFKMPLRLNMVGRINQQIC